MDPKERRYMIKQKSARAMTALRDLEDYARLELRDEILADRVRGVHLALTEDVLQGSTNELSSWWRAKLWDRYCMQRLRDPHKGARARNGFLRRLSQRVGVEYGFRG